jgi:hypothetical protein
MEEISLIIGLIIGLDGGYTEIICRAGFCQGRRSIMKMHAGSMNVFPGRRAEQV